MNPKLYAVLCLLVPLAWGVLSARLFDAWQARRAARRPDPDGAESADMYHI
jgi:hypothetical protein